MNRDKKQELVERISAMRHMMDEHYEEKQDLTNQHIVQLSQSLDQLIVAFMKSNESLDNSPSYLAPKKENQSS